MCEGVEKFGVQGNPRRRKTQLIVYWDHTPEMCIFFPGMK
jgi:hypothetical protein